MKNLNGGFIKRFKKGGLIGLGLTTAAALLYACKGGKDNDIQDDLDYDFDDFEPEDDTEESTEKQ